MNSSTCPARAPRAPWALLVLTAAALALGGCGRKGGLDLPPQAASTQPQGTAVPASDPDANSAAGKGGALTSSNQPDEVRAARGRKRPFVLDKLLD